MPKSLMDDEAIITESATERLSLQGNGGLTAGRDQGFGHLDPDSERFEPLLDSPAAAKLLRIHPKTLQKLARVGRIPAHSVCGLWRFRASELDDWLTNAISSKCHSRSN